MTRGRGRTAWVLSAAMLTAVLAACADDTTSSTGDAAASSPGGTAASSSEALDYDEVGAVLPDPDVVPGWQLAEVEGFGTHDGHYVVTDGAGAEVTVTWRPTPELQPHLDDLEAASDAQEASLFAVPAQLFEVREEEFTLVLELPVEEAAAFLEVHGSGMGGSAFGTFYRSLGPVSVEGFEEAAADAGVALDGGAG